MANAGGVDQLHRNSSDGDGFADEIARGAGSCRDDSALAFDKAIEQAGLADIRAADDRQGQSFMHDLAVGEAGAELFKWRAGGGDVVENLRVRENGDIVFCEVDA